MSGLEIAGVLLGAFPLIISSLEHWRDVAKVGGFFWKIRQEYAACIRKVRFYELLYKRNLKLLLIPIVGTITDAQLLIDSPGGDGWSDKDLQERLRDRLQDSYDLYQETLVEMNEAVQNLRHELAHDKEHIQHKLAKPVVAQGSRPTSPRPPAKSSKLSALKAEAQFDVFKLKFSFNEPVRINLIKQLENGNTKLEKLLSTSDQISCLESSAANDTKQASRLASTLQKAWKKSDHLFRAIQQAWQCTCHQHHFANLRLEHRTTAAKHKGESFSNIQHDIVLMHIGPTVRRTTWTCKAIHCGDGKCNCRTPAYITDLHSRIESLPLASTTQSTVSTTVIPIGSVKSCVQLPARTLTSHGKLAKSAKKQVVFDTTTIPPAVQIIEPTQASLKLCQTLENDAGDQCMGVISHNNETYHLHPKSAQNVNVSNTSTLDHILSGKYGGFLTRRQRYGIALLLASSVAQLQFTPWLASGLSKDKVYFFRDTNDEVTHNEPYIRQGFENSSTSGVISKDSDFSSLGIILLELCFGQRLEDQPFRKIYQHTTQEAKQAFDLMSALKWCKSVRDEGGDDYATAVQWCFFEGAKVGSNDWRTEFVNRVIMPLEKCQECFKAVQT